MTKFETWCYKAYHRVTNVAYEYDEIVHFLFKNGTLTCHGTFVVPD